MRVSFGEPYYSGLAVNLDGKMVPSAVEADDVEGWVKVLRIVGNDGGKIIVAHNPDGTPQTETRRGDVAIMMVVYGEEDGESEISFVPVEWDVWRDMRIEAFKYIYKADSTALRQATMRLDEVLGKMRTQDAQARQGAREAQGEASGEVSTAEREGGGGAAREGDHQRTCTTSPYTAGGPQDEE